MYRRSKHAQEIPREKDGQKDRPQVPRNRNMVKRFLTPNSIGKQRQNEETATAVER